MSRVPEDRRQTGRSGGASGVNGGVAAGSTTGEERRTKLACWSFWFLALLALTLGSPAAWAFDSDLTLGALSVNDNTPDEGQQITYTIEVENKGNDDATSVVVDVPLPSGLTFVSATPDAGTYDSATGVWTIGSLADGQKLELVLVATVDFGAGGSTLITTATITSTDPAWTDGNAGNNSRSVAVTVNIADLQVTKQVNNLTPDEGETVTFTVKVKNQGEAAATNVVARDILTSTLTFVSASANQGTYDAGTGDWTIGDLAKGNERTLTIEATVQAGTSGTAITNAASILSVDQTDTNTVNNSASVEMNVATPDLAVAKSVNDSTPDELQSIEFTIEIANDGPAQATGVEVTDLLPDGVTYVSTDRIDQGIYDPVTGLWDIGTVDDGDKVRLVVIVQVDAGTAARTITNTARVTNLVQTDGDISNNVDSVDIFVNGADLEVTKTVDKPAPSEGDTIVYTITVTNNGPLKANDITITDLLPAGVTFVSSTETQGDAYDSGTGAWVVNDLNALAAATLTITATVDSGTTGTVIVNTAAVTDVVEDDSITDNNSDSAVIAVGEADVAVDKQVNVARAEEGATVTYDVTVTNQGPNTAAGFTVVDQLPAGVTYASHSIAPASGAGVYDPVSGLWFWGINTLNNGSSATLTINATVDSGTAAQTITNTATLIPVQAGNDPSNDSDDVSFQVAGADLGIAKTVDNDRPQTGETFTYTLVVTNNGPDAATGVVVADLLPTGIEYLSDTPTQGSYDSLTGFWTLGGLAVGASATLDIDVTMTSARTAENKAAISASDQADSFTANNEARVTVAGSGSYAAGACIIDLGADADSDGVQDIEEGLAPYGFVYSLMTDHKIPVDWVINPDKATADGVDVTIDGTDYRHGPFIIRPEYADVVIDDPVAGATVREKLAAWAIDNPGFTYTCDLPAFTAPVFDQITFWPRAVLDADNGSIAAGYYTNAGFPDDGSYALIGRPRDLNQCNDIYVMPHADPHTQWLDGEEGKLIDGTTTTVYDTVKFLKFVEQGGQMWAACHAVSAVERLLDVPPQTVWDQAGETPPAVVTPGQTPTGLFLLSDAGLVEWGDHNDASGIYPYAYDLALVADPIMQFLGELDTATESGSENIYLPDDFGASSDWRDTTSVAVYDLNQEDLFTNGGELSEGEAAKVAYGRAYGKPDYGWIMYEAGHSHENGEEVPAQRAFLNFHFLTGILRRPQIQGSLETPVIDRDETDPYNITLTVSGGNPNYTYEWSDSCGGTFDPPDAATTTYTPPAEQENITESRICLIRVSVTDICQRANFAPFPYRVQALDFGDAPNSYDGEGATVDTAQHAIESGGPYLGAIAPDVEDAATDGLPPWVDDDSTGDDADEGIDDEDGVVLSFDLATGKVTATITANNPNAQDARLCGWLDGGNTLPFSVNGVFDRAGTDVPGDEEECVTVAAGAASQTVVMTWDWNTTATATTYARFRITTDPEFFSANSPSPVGPAIDGEIEDHTITITPTSVSIGDVWLEASAVSSMLAALSDGDLDSSVLLDLLAQYDPALADALKGASAAEVEAVLVDYLDPDGDGRVAMLRWDTLQERGTIGFYVERREDGSGGWRRVNGGLLPGMADAPLGGQYWLADPEARSGEIYQYRLIELEAWGTQRKYGPWSLSLSE